MQIMSEQELKFVDIAKGVADRYSRRESPMQDMKSMQLCTKEWTTVFDQAYKAIKATAEGKKD